MSWQAKALEPFDGISPAVIHDMMVKERAQAQAQAEEDARLAAEAEATAAAEAQRHQTLVDAIDALTKEAESHRAAATRAISDAVATAANGLFAAIASQGFADEIAEATAQLIDQSEIAQARLCVAPALHDRIVAVLAARAPERELTVVSDPALPESSARLDWTSGGAEFDANALIDKAKAALARQLETL